MRMRLTMRHQDIDVNLVNQFNVVLAIGVVLVADVFEQGIALSGIGTPS